MENNKFKLYFTEDWFTKNETILTNNLKLKVISTPKSRWYLKLLEFITFRLYKAPIHYTVKPIK